MMVQSAMQKRNFIGSAIFLLLVALGYLVATGYFIFAAPWLTRNPLWLLLTFFWPALMLTEVFLYWRVRNRNDSRKASWAHVVLVAYAFGSFFIKEWIFRLYDDFSPTADIEQFTRIVTRVHLLLFWLSIIGGHIFFIRVLLKARTKKRLQHTADPANLLDDVLS